MRKRKKIFVLKSSIHVYRAMARMTPARIWANRVGVSRQTIIQLERNKYNPSLRFLRMTSRTSLA